MKKDEKEVAEIRSSEKNEGDGVFKFLPGVLPPSTEEGTLTEDNLYTSLFNEVDEAYEK